MSENNDTYQLFYNNNKYKKKAFMTRLKKYNTSLTEERKRVSKRCIELDIIGTYLLKILSMTIRSDRISLHGLVSLKEYFKLISGYKLFDISDILKTKTNLKKSTVFEIFELISKKIESDSEKN